MKTTWQTKILSLLLVAVMVVGLLPTSALAATEKASNETHTVFKDTESTLAPGVTQNIKYAYAADGKQMVYYIATADVTRDDVVVQSSYLKQHEGGVLGMAKLTEQAAYANKKYTNPEDPNYISDYYNVVAGVNSSFYNMQTGQPLGITFIDGVSFGTTSYDNFFAILKDGKTAVIDYAKNLGNYVDENGESAIWQAAAGSQWLVREGKDVTAGVTGSYNTDRHSRTCVGVTAEGKVVLMVLDGRQEPFSCGGSMHELAQIMLEAGCVAAINLDGGGSTTFASKPEGENEFKVINRPSDGSERSISAGIIIASTAVPSDTFDHVSMKAEDEYVTPGTSTKVTVAGVSPAGTAAALPADITYEVTNGTYENGILTAGEEDVDVILTAKHNGKSVGSITIHSVIPEKIAFSSENITVPYGKSLELEMTATYGLNEVKTKASDFYLRLHKNNAGTMNGLTFTACEENAGIESTKITAYYVGYGEISATATLTFGKGSEILWDFEDGDISDWKRSNKSSYNYILTPGTVSLSSKADGGIVHSGNHALKFNMDFSVSTEGGYMSGLLGLNNKEPIDLGGATSFGMWMYIPIEAKSLNGRIFLREVTERNADGSIKSYNTDANSTDATMDGDSNWNVGFVTQFEESGWHYISFDLTRNGELGFCIPENGVLLDIYVNDRDNTEFKYNHLDYSSLNQNVVMYIDDVTLDYSSVVDDREFPIFSGVNYADKAMSDASGLTNGITIGANTADNRFDFSVNVAENTKKANATGLDAATAKAYIDGVEVACTFDGSKISISDVVLVNGNHTIKFSICDKQGNYASVIRKFTVNAKGNDLPTISLKPHDAKLDKILLGSVYYVDIVATAAENVNSVVVDLDLNNISRWQLDHMEVAKGFTATYEILDKDENIARVTITKTGKNDSTGELILVSMPIRTWELPCLVCDGGTGKKGQYATYEFFKKGSETWPIDISVSVISGILNGETTFAGDKVQVDTESYVWDNATKPADYATWNGGHDHRPETKDLYSEGSTNHVDAIALPDKAATCTENGYTGRTYCEVCNSVVDWGTTVEAEGHHYEFVDGVLKCHCGETFSGVHTDGKTYENGTLAAGWLSSSYYVDGVKLTGIQKIDGYYYDFGDDGISLGKYTGLFYDSEINAYRYAQFGKLSAGWKMINDEWYYFRETTLAAATGRKYEYSVGVYYTFDVNGRVISGEWKTTSEGTRYYYGPSYYRCASTTSNAALFEINGNTYAFDHSGYMCVGVCRYRESASKNYTWYDFGTDGILKGVATGLFSDNGLIYYVKNGVEQRGAGLVEVDGNFYYVRQSGAVATGKYWVSNTNGIEGFAQQYYQFDETGKMILKNGVIDGYYYVKDKLVKGAGLVEVEGNFYYVRQSGAVATGKYWVSNTNGIEGFAQQYYQFDETGKMILN